jgi:hypothetical protein
MDHSRAEAEEKLDSAAPRAHLSEGRAPAGAGVDVAAIKRELRAVLDQLQG